MHFTKKQICEDATNEHIAAVVDNAACHGDLSSVVVVHLRNVCHFGVFGQRQPQHLRRATSSEIAIRQLTISVYCGDRKNNNGDIVGINEKHTITKVTAERRRIYDDGYSNNYVRIVADIVILSCMIHI